MNTKKKDIISKYNESQTAEKLKIKAIPQRKKRFLAWLKYILLFPFKWLWVNLRDWKTLVIFATTFLILSSEVWVFYLLSLINIGSEFSAWALGIASACWLFWLGPGTPFLPLCIVITIGIKELFNKRKLRKEVKNNEQSI